MAVRIDLHIDEVRDALEKRLSAIKTALAKQRNPLIREIYSKDLAAVQHAVNTLTEIK